LIALANNYGENARYFSATMFAMWTPGADTRCTDNQCAIPIPLGSLTWQFTGDAINSLKTQMNGGYTFPLWQKNAASVSAPNILYDDAYPLWSPPVDNPL
jgi:hypothetical protein